MKKYKENRPVSLVFVLTFSVVSAVGCSVEGKTDRGEDPPGRPQHDLRFDSATILAGPMQRDSVSREIWQASGIIPLSTGGVLIASSGNSQIVRLDGDGNLLETWGRQGEGPNEFQLILDVFGCGDDNVLVVQSGRVGLFDSSGDLIRVARDGDIAGERIPTVFGVSSDCDRLLIAERHAVPATPREIGSTRRDSWRVMWAALGEGRSDTLGMFPGNEVTYVDLGDGRPIPSRLHWLVEPIWDTDGELAILLPNERHANEFLMLRPDGMVDGRVTWTGPDRTITDADWDRYFDAVDRLIRANPRERLMIPRRSRHPRPDERPVGSNMLVDQVCRVWIEVFRVPRIVEQPDREIWWVFTTGGNWLASITTPRHFRLLAASRAVAWGTVTDSLGRELPAKLDLRFLSPEP